MDKLFTKAEYLLLAMMQSDPELNYMEAMEAIYSTALAHPEWNMTQQRTFEEWESEK